MNLAKQIRQKEAVYYHCINTSNDIFCVYLYKGNPKAAIIGRGYFNHYPDAYIPLGG